MSYKNTLHIFDINFYVIIPQLINRHSFSCRSCDLTQPLKSTMMCFFLDQFGDWNPRSPNLNPLNICHIALKLSGLASMSYQCAASGPKDSGPNETTPIVELFPTTLYRLSEILRIDCSSISRGTRNKRASLKMVYLDLTSCRFVLRLAIRLFSWVKDALT